MRYSEEIPEIFYLATTVGIRLKKIPILLLLHQIPTTFKHTVVVIQKPSTHNKLGAKIFSFL